MKKRVRKLQLSKESVSRLDLGQAVVGGVTAGQTGCIACNTIDRTACFTDCRLCGNTNYVSCLC